VIVLETRGGPARARNTGARAARGAELLIIDADVEVPPDQAARVARFFCTHPGPAAVIASYDDSPGHTGFASQFRNLLLLFVHQTARDEASTFWAGCGAVRRAAFDDVGGFDERFAVPSIEDNELGTRLIRAGHAIRIDKLLQVKHHKAWSLRDMFATDLWRRAVPWTELMLGDGALVNDLNVKTGDRVSVALALVIPLALAGSWRWPLLLAVGGLALAAIVAINWRFFGFLRRRRGVRFALGALPLYEVYLLICGCGFTIGVARHIFGRDVTRRARPPVQ
jgi:glycosyltransferase involved in cell wall biosynthesis